jgi:thiosulfate/3-mercaptopyruvate sulfurtransferase
MLLCELMALLTVFLTDVPSVRYDSYGIFSAPRALYMLRAFGHNNSSVLNGGLPRWEADGLSLEQEDVSVKEAEYQEPTMDPSFVRSESSRLCQGFPN